MSYQFDHKWEAERARLAALEQAFDPWSIRTIRATDPQPGWRCLEVGGGGGSMAAWLCDLVGGSGSVVATDLETKFLETISAENLEIREHDIATDELETELGRGLGVSMDVHPGTSAGVGDVVIPILQRPRMLSTTYLEARPSLVYS